jgi:predicted ester cyclase
MKGLGEAFNAHDAAKMATFVTDDLSSYDYGNGELHSKGEFQNAMSQLFQWFPDTKSAPTRVWVKGNVVVAEMVWTATMTSDVMGLKATNKPVGQLRAHVYFFNEDGLVKEIHEYADSAGLTAQMTGQKTAPPVPVMPTNPPELHIAGGHPDNEKLDDWARTLDEAFNKDEPKAVQALTMEDADFWVNFGGPAMKGRKEMEAGLTAWFKAFPDQKWTSSPSSAWGYEGWAIIEHAVSGTQKGAIGPLRATGKPVQNWHWLDILQPSADGKLQHGWGYANLFEMMGQTGALKKPGEKPAATQAKGPGKAPAASPAPGKAPATSPAPSAAPAPKK